MPPSAQNADICAELDSTGKPGNLYLLLETLVARAGARDMCQTIEFRRKQDVWADARLFFKSPESLSSAEVRLLLHAMARNPAIERIDCRHSAISVRFTDETIWTLGRQLEDDNLASLGTSDLLPHRAFLVGFVGPNTCKALHVGHLRNISVGHALSALLASAGAGVVLQSLVGDIGRNVFEAIAGLRRFGLEQDITKSSMKSDHFVGKYYSDFVRACDGKRTSSDPVSRELNVAGDEADKLISGWLAGNPEVHALWRRVRDVVLEGHRQTLQHFGVEMNRYDFESEAMADIAPMIEAGVQRGILTRSLDGTVVFNSGRAEYPSMILVREDGFPTEHARLIAVYRRIARDLPDTTYIDLAGTEWQPASVVHEQLMGELGDRQQASGKHLFLYHEMVTMADNEKVSSSSGDALLLDDLLDQVVSSRQIQSLATSPLSPLDQEALAVMILKLFFLCRPASKTVVFSWKMLMDEYRNPGWLVASTWRRVHQPAAECEKNVTGEEDAYRLVVLRAQDLRRNVAQAAQQLCTTPLSSYLFHMCEHISVTPLSPRLRRLTQRVLATTMRHLGLLIPMMTQRTSTRNNQAGIPPNPWHGEEGDSIPGKQGKTHLTG